MAEAIKSNGSRSKWIALFAIGAMAVLSACGGPPPPPARTPLTFAWIPKDTNVIYEEGRDGANLRAKELSSTSNNDVTIMQLVADGQPTDLMQQAIDANVNGIAISPADAAKQQPLIDAAVD